MGSPCVRCTTLADCSRCPDFDAWLRTTEPVIPTACATCDDVEFLLLAGESFDQIPGRVAVKRASLLRHLGRHGRTDLIPRRVMV